MPLGGPVGMTLKLDYWDESDGWVLSFQQNLPSIGASTTYMAWTVHKPTNCLIGKQ